MFYISAQPDKYYFLWQLQIQLYNFNLLGIPSQKIHVLIGYNREQGLSLEFKEFIKNSKLAQFYCYQDTRKDKSYLSSLRPHIIAKHFIALPHMQDEILFYHDSDIVFKELPNFKELNEDNIWYTSYTSSYLNTTYIRSSAGDKVFTEMCQAVGISPSVVIANDANAGGAQYVIKKSSIAFWHKMENDCEKLYSLLEKHNNKLGFCSADKHPKNIQAWCADMWALWWNALLQNKEFKVHKELDFCWAISSIDDWYLTKILHYTGSVSKENKALFRKTNYINYSPFFDSLATISDETCSFKLKQLIDDYSNAQLEDRYDLTDVSFLIPVRIDSDDRIENLQTVITYLLNNFKCSVLVMEADNYPKINTTQLPPEVKYFFVKDDHPKLHRTKYHNQLITKATTPYIVLYDADVVFTIGQIIESVSLLRSDNYAMVSPYNGNFVSVDSLLKAMLIKLQDVELFEVNIGKLVTGTKRSYGGCVFINRIAYIEAGMENENIHSWGPDDIERIKRMEILGYNIKRVQGNLYHLPHRRGLNSSYENIDEQCALMSEYLKICMLEKDELNAYIQTWAWTNN